MLILKIRRQLSKDKFVEWSAKWQLPINISECSVLTIICVSLTHLVSTI